MHTPMSQVHFGADNDLFPCGKTQTTSHIVKSCPLTKLNGGLSQLHSADEDAVSWLTNCGSRQAYEKKILVKKYFCIITKVLWYIQLSCTKISQTDTWPRICENSFLKRLRPFFSTCCFCIDAMVSVLRK